MCHSLPLWARISVGSSASLARGRGKAPIWVLGSLLGLEPGKELRHLGAGAPWWASGLNYARVSSSSAQGPWASSQKSSLRLCGSLRSADLPVLCVGSVPEWRDRGDLSGAGQADHTSCQWLLISAAIQHQRHLSSIYVTQDYVHKPNENRCPSGASPGPEEDRCPVGITSG